MEFENPIAKEILDMLASKGLSLASAREALLDAKSEIAALEAREIEKHREKTLLSDFLSL